MRLKSCAFGNKVQTFAATGPNWFEKEETLLANANCLSFSPSNSFPHFSLLPFPTFDRGSKLSINSRDRFLIFQHRSLHCDTFHFLRTASPPTPPNIDIETKFPSVARFVVFSFLGHTFWHCQEPRLRTRHTYYFFFSTAININISDSTFCFSFATQLTAEVMSTRSLSSTAKRYIYNYSDSHICLHDSRMPSTGCFAILCKYSLVAVYCMYVNSR